MSQGQQQEQQQQQQTAIPNWHLKMDYVETCNCDYGCPCNFSGFPTYGYCRDILLHHIQDGNYGDIRLDGLDVVYAASWPKAIHEGNGTMQLFISKNASDKQRDALIKIFSGEAKGEGHFAIFRPTFKYILEPQFVDIIAKINDRKSSFSVPGIIDVELESFKDPVTGEEHEARLQLPKGFIFKIADAAKTKLMRISTPNMNYDDSGQSAYFAQVEYRGP
jgi:hypothetical protein